MIEQSKKLLFYITLLIIGFILSSLFNIYFLFRGLETTEVPVYYNISSDKIVNKELLLNYNDRANSLCFMNGYAGGFIFINNSAYDVNIICFDRENKVTKVLNLAYVEILGEPSLIK